MYTKLHPSAYVLRYAAAFPAGQNKVTPPFNALGPF